MEKRLLEVGDVIVATTLLGQRKFTVTRVTKTQAVCDDNNYIKFKREYSYENGYVRIRRVSQDRWNGSTYELIPVKKETNETA